MLIYSRLESVTLSQISNPYDKRLNSRKNLNHCALLAFSLIQPVYATVKGSLILYAIEKHDTYVRMHPPYNALTISAIAFGFLELALALASFSAMKKLKVQRITHWLNDQGGELDKDGKPITKSANLRRVFGLAKPVSSM